MRQGSNFLWFLRAAVGAAILLGAVLLTACGSVEDVDLTPACPTGVGRGIWDPGSLEGKDAGPEVRKLLESPRFGATPQAVRDLERGIVDQRLIAALRTLTQEHRICVRAFKEGHYFLPGVEDGPRIPEGYSKAGGLPNTHYYGRAADVWWVDGKPVEGNATDQDVMEIGEILAGIPSGRRPDQIIGPPRWARDLGYGNQRGWILAPDQLELHRDHIHIGYVNGEATNETR
ncbi:MAG: hypothetical protein M3491_05405 [Actinomycetota bacterium]|nr:hypothetical protein [Actinomycetota bacterium]